jgi:hypothetical protein
MDGTMKYHKTLDQCFKDSNLPKSQRAAFEQGWYCCASEINNGEDSDWLQERLYAEGFLYKEEEEN